jgi:hypothetical protein
MSKRFGHQLLEARREIVAAPAPPLQRACDDHTFELPPVLHLASAAFFLGFVTILCLAFSTNMMVSWAVIAALIGAFFGVPALFVAASPKGKRALGWEEFLERGIDTATGRTAAGEATALVLVLPFLVLCWAVAVVTIAAFVR